MRNSYTLEGQFSYRFYDKQDCLGFTVEANGRLTEYRYDVQHRYKITIEYVHPLDKEKLAARPLPETEPTINDLFQLMEDMAIAHPEVDAEGYLSTRDYLLNGLIRSEKYYANPRS